jgi:hypothetical protein
VYASLSNVVLLSATPSLGLAETLPFWTALPHRAGSSHAGEVEGVHCDNRDGLVSGPVTLLSQDFRVERRPCRDLAVHLKVGRQ